MDSLYISNKSDQEEELKSLTAILTDSREKYFLYTFFRELIRECETKSDLDPETKQKIKYIRVRTQCLKSLGLDNSEERNSSTSLLGIEALSKKQLTYSESDKLNKIVKNKIQKTLDTLEYELKKLNLPLEPFETNLLDFSNEDKTLIEYRSKLFNTQLQYLKNLEEYEKILEEIADLRLNKLKIAVDKKIDEGNLQTKINSLKDEITQEKVRINIFEENNISKASYKTFIEDLKKQEEKCLMDIKDLQELKQQYANVSCKQFDEILSQFIQYKHRLEKRNILYECMKN